LSASSTSRALDRLKDDGFWIYGLDETASQPLASSLGSGFNLMAYRVGA
jgi:hypothetical protein